MTADLSTSYLGLALAHPVVASAGPLAATVEGVRRLAAGGAAAVVLPSLFEEDLRAEHARLERWRRQGVGVVAEAPTYLPELPAAPGVGERYVALVRAARAAVDVPVIASLNGIVRSSWVHWATELDDAGAHALELNVYRVAADPADTSAPWRTTPSRWSRRCADASASRWR